MNENEVKRTIEKKMAKLLKQYDIKNYFFIGQNKNFAHGGMSITRNDTKDPNENPIHDLRQALIKWELKHGSDPHEDWKK